MDPTPSKRCETPCRPSAALPSPPSPPTGELGGLSAFSVLNPSPSLGFAKGSSFTSYSTAAPVCLFLCFVSVPRLLLRFSAFPSVCDTSVECGVDFRRSSAVERSSTDDGGGSKARSSSSSSRRRRRRKGKADTPRRVKRGRPRACPRCSRGRPTQHNGRRRTGARSSARRSSERWSSPRRRKPAIPRFSLV